MKDFLKYIFATVIGIILTGSILFLLSMVTIFGIIASSEKETPIQDNSVMTIHLVGSLEERATINPLATLMGETENIIGLNDLLSAIQKAKEDVRIKGIYLEAGQLSNASPASLEEARKALLDFKQTGKFVVAYGDVYNQGEYYLCSVADKIILNPQGVIDWKGLSSQPIFYKDLLEKLGIEMQIFKVGTYKSAVEPFIANQMSEANRMQVQAYLNSIWERIVSDVATSRGLTIDSLNFYANQGISLKTPKEFIATQLADTLMYKDEMKSYLKELVGIEKDEELQTLNMKEMGNIQKNIPMSKSGNILAVYYATGEIVDVATNQFTGDENYIVGTRITKDLSKLREDDNVKAVVLRINSPGGSAFASEQIWNEVVKLKARKPVVVSMGGMAASGGYYISCAADTIFAEATTLTGSIGIFGMIPNMQNLLNNKLGIYTDIVKTNRYSDLGDISRPLTPAESQFIQNSIERGYDLFVTRCADGRNMSKEEIQNIAEGRVWTGCMAQEIGLVDALGGINDAIATAAQLANITEYSLISYPEVENPFVSLFNESKDNYIESRIKEETGAYYKYLKQIQHLQKAAPIQTHIGFEPNIQL